MSKKTLVLGTSTNPGRYSYLTIQQLIVNKHEVRAVGKNEGEISGVKIYTNKKIFRNVNTISLYLNKKNQRDYYDYIVDLKPQRVLFNPGSENVELEKILFKNKISFERACTLVLLSIGEY